MDIERRIVDGVTVLDVFGEISQPSELTDMKSAVMDCLREKSAVVITTKDITRMSIAGLGAILETSIELQSRGKRLALVLAPDLYKGTTAHLPRTLNQAGLIFDTETEAVAELRQTA